MSYTYLASPYSHANPRVQEDRYVRALDALQWLTSRRIWTFSPIVQCHELAKRYDLPTDAGTWQSFNRTMLQPASTLMILEIDGWTTSRGVEFEVKVAREERIPINFLQPRTGNLLGYKIITAYDKETLPWR